MQFSPTERDFNEFLRLYEGRPFRSNDGGMKAPDMFTLFFTCRAVKPRLVVESGVWRGQSTWLIRNACGQNTTIACLDPSEIPDRWIDVSPRTTYLTGSNFVDFSELSVDEADRAGTLCLFDDHQDAWMRLEQSAHAGIKSILFNDNYPVGCGSHRTLAHCRREDIDNICRSYTVFPNIVGPSVQTGEGAFACQALFDITTLAPSMRIFLDESNAYRWNTFVELH
jgi:hypothetical protein